jgi:hypothetical protein
MIKKEEVPFLKQLISSLEKTTEKLEIAYEKKDYEEFTKLKRFILKIQEQISQIIK